MAKVFITLTGTKHYFGNDYLKKGKKIRLEKEPDNEYDKEAKIGCISSVSYTHLDVYKRQDGSSIYATRDLAALLYRKRTYNFDKCIYVTGSVSYTHLKRLSIRLRL